MTKPKLGKPVKAMPDEAVQIVCVLWTCRREIPLKMSTFTDDAVKWVKERCDGRFWIVRTVNVPDFRDDEIAGGMLIASPDDNDGMKREHHEVLWMAIDPQYRQLGVGSILLEHAKTQHEVLTAIAQEENVAANSLLERGRFQISGKIRPGGWVPYEWSRAECEG